ncbi:exodeoxyribonuclease V subunit alpha [Aggregicoccus sp. 17bor-14]|uniref:exodeoxyribonuclease V subunit alpha n=1 Tax=Myxococcaceae TaxID=31 RepID=UPI00129C1440|nr:MULTISPECIES: exodeoxyribonuclease V subunit alpha [Myxococcaceae]MBF5044759.1 exodeoxyribonuclease V subunit alpha [Simulacricoccus sp. 17bor-14]MRI90503.1 exodeoxyribonuclease V subunit alpha [Aggregicoccus sp. 17bor-14]
MRQDKWLVPTGTAAREVVRVNPALGRRNTVLPAFPSFLLEGASQWEDGPEMLHLAWELARCAPEATAEESKALVMLAFAALVSVREGSTRMPVRGEAGRAFLGAVLERLGAHPKKDLEAVLALVETLPEGVRTVLGGPERPLVLDGQWLSLQKLRHSEDQLVGALRARMTLPPVLAEGEAKARLAEVLERPPLAGGKPLKLSEEQQRAVATAMCRPLTLITGGPGTGKTSIVVSLLRTLVRLGVAPETIALAAPTGKAAMRMDESVRAALGSVSEPSAEDTRLLEARPPARTLHRLLGYSPSTDRFLHHALNPLAEDVVIVDESSMVDLFLMDRLVRSLKPGARLVLLGDADQLPSVDAGAVFRDLVPDEAPPSKPAPAKSPTKARKEQLPLPLGEGWGEGAGFPTVPPSDPRAASAVRLTQSYRMDPSDPAGRNILTVARAVKAGQPVQLGGEGDARAALRTRARDLALSGMEVLECEPGGTEFQSLLDRWDTDVLRGGGDLDSLVRREYRFGLEGCVSEDAADLERLFRRFESARLLCLTRSPNDPSGTGAINAYFHRRALRLATGLQRQAPEFLPGEPLLVEANDYDRKLFNGDQGLVVRGVDLAGDRQQHFMAAFRSGDGFVAFHLDGLRGRIQHAYAMTVHKSQGSEFDRVALVLPSRDLPLLTRELLYTGMTRARRSVVVVGASALLQTGVQRGLSRWSGVAERIRGA